jgi:ubiquinone/menaquinone biosynthesis C-methylase UbiE
MEKNASVYNTGHVVDHYLGSADLQKPEETILQILQPLLPQMNVLDLGVGGGRTTPYLAKSARSYIGVDLSAGMIDGCKAKFATQFPGARFEVCDVRDLSRFKDDEFDLVLFSFNGVDNIACAERAAVLREIRRICKPGGYFCFSSHNLLTLPEFFKFHFRFHPIKLIKNFIGRRRLLARHGDILERLPELDQATIYDDVYDFGLFTCYVRPSYQVRQLQETGFKEIALFNGQGLKLGADEQQTDTSSWIYYLCH